jgi:iron(III) transport system substrate-binding protein
VVYCPPGAAIEAALIGRFQKAFPEIRVESTLGVGGALLSKLAAERAGGRYLADVWINGSTVILRGLKPSGGLVPLDPYLILPEVRDKNAWLQNMLWWNDGSGPNTNLSFGGILYPVAYINTNLAKLSAFRSYWDIADVKWKGKVCSNDIRIIGPGGVPASYIYKNGGLGEPWFRKFFGELNVVMGRDQRQLVDGLAQGRYAIAAFVSSDEAIQAINQGLPIAPIPLEQLKEGGAVGPGPAAISVVDRAPHPNAAKVYVNWLLSREGQIAFQEETKIASLRTDVPKNNVILVPKPGKTYVNAGAEAYGSTLQGIGTLVTDIMSKAGAA